MSHFFQQLTKKGRARGSRKACGGGKKGRGRGGQENQGEGGSELNACDVTSLDPRPFLAFCVNENSRRAWYATARE